MDPTWQDRDLPALRAIVQAFDDADRHSMTLDEVQTMTGLSDDDVKRAARALYEAEPPLIKGIGADQVTYPLRIVGVTERARVRAGQWPNPDDIVDTLAAALEERAAQAEEPEEQSRLRSLADGLRGIGREITVRVLSGYGGDLLGP